MACQEAAYRLVSLHYVHLLGYPTPAGQMLLNPTPKHRPKKRSAPLLPHRSKNHRLDNKPLPPASDAHGKRTNISESQVREEDVAPRARQDGDGHAPAGGGVDAPFAEGLGEALLLVVGSRGHDAEVHAAVEAAKVLRPALGGGVGEACDGARAARVFSVGSIQTLKHTGISLSVDTRFNGLRNEPWSALLASDISQIATATIESPGR